MKKPSIDVVIPNYNYGHYLRECAQSVLTQEGVDVRLLIIDNASVDDSAEQARDLAARDERIELLLRSKNVGPHASFNEGIDWAQSDYFLILCADDLLSKGALLRAVDLLERYPDVHLAHGAVQKISKDETCAQMPAMTPAGKWKIRPGTDFIAFSCRHAFNPVFGPTAVVRTLAQKRVGYYRSALSHTDDLEMWLRIALLGCVASTDDVQAYARVHSGNQSATVSGIMRWSDEFEAGFRSFFDHEGVDMPDAERHFSAVCDCLTKRAYWSAISNLLRREEGAAALMGFALKRHPWMALIPPFDYLLERRKRVSQF